MSGFDEFEWDEAKRQATIVKHGLDFALAITVFAANPLIVQSPRGDERRWLAIGKVGSRYIAVVFTRRGTVIRIITARKARDYERKDYDENDSR